MVFERDKSPECSEFLSEVIVRQTDRRASCGVWNLSDYWQQQSFG